MNRKDIEEELYNLRNLLNSQVVDDKTKIKYTLERIGYILAI